MDSLLQLFTEGAAAAQLVPFSSQALFFAMRGFEIEGMRGAAFVSAAGATAGSSINWLLGKALIWAKDKGHIYVKDTIYDRLAKLARTWLLPLTLLTWIAFGGFITVIFSFLRVPVKYMLPGTALGWLGYYLYYAMH